MCGIGGYIGQGNPQILKAMNNTLKHRGPDDEGIFYRRNVGFAHTRLSVLDVSKAGAQPMLNHDKTLIITFNGEIYNFQELKQEYLQDKKNFFRSKTDTEVILYLYERFGEACFKNLNGMFALAIYDFRDNSLILARDRMGQKPLYWGIFQSTLIFASELKALLNHPLTKKELDLTALNKYLFYDYVPTPQCIFKNIFKLEPATYLKYQKGQIQKHTYWDLKSDQQVFSQNGAIKRFDYLIKNSVKMRLASDVPLGVFLSGGLDSSTIAYYAQNINNKNIQTFSLGFEEKPFDESFYAQKVADWLKSEHRHICLKAQDVLNLIPKIGEIMDEPLADPSFVPTILLSSFTKKKVTVALAGDGGDELLAGYPTFQAEYARSMYRRIPRFIRDKLIKRVVKSLPASYDYYSIDYKLKRFLDGLANNHYRHNRWIGSIMPEQITLLFKDEIKNALTGENIYDHLDRYMRKWNKYESKNRLLYLYQRTYLMDSILTKVDRASMLNGLEVRAPFLDFRIIDFLNSLPYQYKLKHLTTKYILKKMMKHKLPNDIVHRAKKGFGFPLAKWLRKELKDFCEDVLSKDNIRKTGLFQYRYVQQLKNNHMAGKENLWKPLWTLIVFQIWMDQQK